MLPPTGQSAVNLETRTSRVSSSIRVAQRNGVGTCVRSCSVGPNLKEESNRTLTSEFLRILLYTAVVRSQFYPNVFFWGGKTQSSVKNRLERIIIIIIIIIGSIQSRLFSYYSIDLCYFSCTECTKGSGIGVGRPEIPYTPPQPPTPPLP